MKAVANDADQKIINENNNKRLTLILGEWDGGAPPKNGTQDFVFSFLKDLGYLLFIYGSLDR